MVYSLEPTFGKELPIAFFIIYYYEQTVKMYQISHLSYNDISLTVNSLQAHSLLSNFFTMKPFVASFLGRSGAGKGTQAKLLVEKLKEQGIHESKIQYLSTGQAMREYIEKYDTLTQKKAKEIMDRGGRHPDFFAINIWGRYFIKHYTGEEYVIIDGAPRSRVEAEVFNTARWFYPIDPFFVVHVNVSKAWSKTRLMERGRADDTDKEIEARLAYFDLDVAPAVTYFKQNPEFTYLNINGEQPIDDVHKEILNSLGI